MKSEKILSKLKEAVERDPSIVCTRDKAQETLGSDARYLSDILSLEKSDLIRLERLGYAMKARYETKTGEHRTRWIIFAEALV